MGYKMIRISGIENIVTAARWCRKNAFSHRTMPGGDELRIYNLGGKWLDRFLADTGIVDQIGDK